MSNPRLPGELLDHIVDHLRDTNPALMNCCLVSKSWIPRTRKHLFADIRFDTEEHLRSWKKTFSDPSTSPARYAEALFVRCPHVVTAADGEPGGWITGFSRVVQLEVSSRGALAVAVKPTASLVPFHGFSPTVKSLLVSFFQLSSSQILNFALSFPLLEDLTVGVVHRVSAGNDDGSDGVPVVVKPSNLPTFNGSLGLFLNGGMGPITRRLLSLPGGIHFRKLTLKWFHEEDVLLTTALVEKCSHTLEYLNIARHLCCTSVRACICTDNSLLFPVEPESTPVNLSKATKLGSVVFRPESLNIEWITVMLQTITSKNRALRQISIHAPGYSRLFKVSTNIRQSIGEAACGLWSDLDRPLIQFWESRSLHPKVICVMAREETRDTSHWIECLMPEATGRGMIDFIECY